jgi:hypothetical protein
MVPPVPKRATSVKSAVETKTRSAFGALNLIHDVLSTCCALSDVTHKLNASGHTLTLTLTFSLFGTWRLCPKFVRTFH